MRDLLAIQVIVELNVAFCERHLVTCPASEQLEKECTYVSISCVCSQSYAYLVVLQTCYVWVTAYALGSSRVTSEKFRTMVPGASS